MLFAFIAFGGQVFLSWLTLCAVDSKKNSTKWSALKLFIQYSLFYFVYKCLVFNGAFYSFYKVYENIFEASLIVLVLFAILSLYSGLLSGLFLLCRPLVSKHVKCFILAAITLLFDRLNETFLPHPTYLFLLNYKWTGVVLSFIGKNLFCFLYFLICFIFAQLLLEKKKKKIAIIFFVMVLSLNTFYFIASKARKNSLFQIKLIMVQTDKLANLNAFKKIEKDILIRLDEIRKRKEEVYPVLVVFPEYTFEDSSKAFAELREIIQHRSKGERIYWGVGVSKRLDSEKGIMNIVEIFQSHSLTKHVKSKLFPIGEREINFYILPNKYFIPAVKVIPGEEELSSFEIGVKGESLQVINAICYESIYLDLLKRALGPKFANRMIVNYSYDGLLKGSSLSYMHDLLTRWNAISLNSHLVRISSREHSAVWDNYGANVISLPLNQDVVKEVDVQFFE